MPNLHVLMTNHSDVNSIKLLIEQLPFIKEHYETFAVECVPYGLKNEEILQYLSKVMLTYVLDLTAINEQLGLSKIHLLALKNVYTATLTDEEKMRLKYEAVKEIVDNAKCDFEPNIKQVLYQFYYYHYLSEAIKMGIELVGVESSSYSPGAGKFQPTRDQDVVANTLNVMRNRQNVLMLVGASHGIDLIKANKKNGTMRNSYTHLYCDSTVISSNAPSQRFKREIESGDYSLTDNQSYLYLDLSEHNANGRTNIFQQRVLDTKSKKAVYHEYGRKLMQVGGSFCQALSKLGRLPFCISLDKEYYADTVCVIENVDDKNRAKEIQEKTGLGSFFKVDRGANIFVIKNTNEPDNGETLRDALNKL